MHLSAARCAANAHLVKLRLQQRLQRRRLRSSLPARKNEQQQKSEHQVRHRCCRCTCTAPLRGLRNQPALPVTVSGRAAECLRRRCVGYMGRQAGS